MVIVPTGQVLRKQIKSYLPDFSQAFEHVCIHTGGRGVIDEMEKQLKLSPALMAPSRDTPVPLRQHILLLHLVRTPPSLMWSTPAA